MKNKLKLYNIDIINYLKIIMQPLKILIVRLSSLGDVIHTFPMINDIKINLPNTIIDWVVDESFADIIKLNNNINKIIPISLRKWKKNKFTLITNVKNWSKSIDNKNYDYIIDSQGLLKSAIIANTFIGKHYGFSFNSIKEKLASFFYDEHYSISKNQLAINRNRLLASAIFKYKINLDILNFNLTPKLSSEFDYLKNYVIFFHATSKENKKLKTIVWQQLATYLINKYNLNIVIPYGNYQEKDESLLIKTKINSDKVFVFEKVLNYNKIADLIFNANVIIGVDTGLIHLANALNKKVIAIYVNSDPSKTGIIESDNAYNLDLSKNGSDIETIIKTFNKMN